VVLHRLEAQREPGGDRRLGRHSCVSPADCLYWRCKGEEQDECAPRAANREGRPPAESLPARSRRARPPVSRLRTSGRSAAGGGAPDATVTGDERGRHLPA
jgi:hypothetical protein